MGLDLDDKAFFLEEEHSTFPSQPEKRKDEQRRSSLFNKVSNLRAKKAKVPTRNKRESIRSRITPFVSVLSCLALSPITDSLHPGCPDTRDDPRKVSRRSLPRDCQPRASSGLLLHRLWSPSSRRHHLEANYASEKAETGEGQGRLELTDKGGWDGKLVDAVD